MMVCTHQSRSRARGHRSNLPGSFPCLLLRSARKQVDRPKVIRRSIKVIKSRLEDIAVGDVVNRNPEAEQGWFTVAAISTLFNGHIQIADETEQLTVSGDNMDMVGLQLVEEVLLDDRGLVPAAPQTTMAPAPAPQAAAPVTAEPSQAPPTNSAPDEGVVDLAAEAAAAAKVATEMDTALAMRKGTSPTGVDLALVASLLEDLDVGEAPAISTELSGEPMLPPNAVAVDGGALPEKPSYKNPVVVPEGGMLPRRNRAA